MGGITVLKSVMVDMTVINGGTVVLLQTARTEGEGRKVVNDLSTKLKITLMLHHRK